MDNLAQSYSKERDKRIIDLLVYMKYYSPHAEYTDFIIKIKNLLITLQGIIRPSAFDNVRAALGIKDLAHLDILCGSPKNINYNKLGNL